jgi:hypothetical protein
VKKKLSQDEADKIWNDPVMLKDWSLVRWTEDFLDPAEIDAWSLEVMKELPGDADIDIARFPLPDGTVDGISNDIEHDSLRRLIIAVIRNEHHIPSNDFVKPNKLAIINRSVSKANLMSELTRDSALRQFAWEQAFKPPTNGRQGHDKRNIPEETKLRIAAAKAATTRFKQLW